MKAKTKVSKHNEIWHRESSINQQFLRYGATLYHHIYDFYSFVGRCSCLPVTQAP